MESNERAELPAVEAQRLLQLRYLQPVSTFRQGGTMARPLSLCATAGASRHPVLPYTPDSENLLSAAECSGGLTLLRLRPLATERGPFCRSALHFLIKAKHEHGVTLPDCEGNWCAKHVSSFRAEDNPEKSDCRGGTPEILHEMYN